MNATVVQNYIINIGSDIGNHDIFLSYGYIINTTVTSSGTTVT